MLNAPVRTNRSSHLSSWRRVPLDPVERTIHQLARQGTTLARLAHLFATLMVVLFSLGSLAALSGDAISAILVTISHHGLPSIPQAISVAVSTLMVVCCDIGLVYAAMTLRVLRTRGSDEGQALHWAVLIGVSIIEAGTYLYMSAIYEQPHGWAWGLVIARAFAAPLLSVYLSMAHAHPVTPRDILHQAELAQGIQLVRDVVRVAQDPSAQLADKMRLYEASAEMTGRDKARLTRMINVVQQRLGEPALLAPLEPLRMVEEEPSASGRVDHVAHGDYGDYGDYGDRGDRGDHGDPTLTAENGGEANALETDLEGDSDEEIAEGIVVYPPRSRYNPRRITQRIEATR